MMTMMLMMQAVPLEVADGLHQGFGCLSLVPEEEEQAKEVLL